MTIDFDALTLTDMIRLREQLSNAMTRRFERHLALAFSDITDSTAYFSQFGDEAGRGLQQRHFDALAQVLPRHRGRLVDTAGDGAFTCFPDGDSAAAAMVALAEVTAAQNASRPPEHRLGLRIGIHCGQVLTDGEVVAGDAVNLCSRVSSSALAGEIRLTRAAFLELATANRLRCRPLATAPLKGITRPVELYALDWRERGGQATAVRVVETGETHPLPEKLSITFGRLKEHQGAPANDIVLAIPDKTDQLRISRWHFEVRRQTDGLVLVALTDNGTEVDGQALARGQQTPVRPGTVVQVAGVVTLTFLADARDTAASDEAAHATVMREPPAR